MNNPAPQHQAIFTTEDAPQNKVLPQDPSMAINTLIRITRNLSNLADREAQALAQDDMLTFSILQDEKGLTAENYVNACSDFQSNVNAYRGCDKNMLARLDALQKELGEKTQNNNNTVEQLYDRSKNRTTNSLLAPQEIAQWCYINL